MPDSSGDTRFSRNAASENLLHHVRDVRGVQAEVLEDPDHRGILRQVAEGELPCYSVVSRLGVQVEGRHGPLVFPTSSMMGQDVESRHRNRTVLWGSEVEGVERLVNGPLGLGAVGFMVTFPDNRGDKCER